MAQETSSRCFDCQNSLVASFVGSIGEVQADRAADLPSEANVWTLVKEIVKMSIPLGIASVAQFSVNPVMIAMVGNMIGVEQLGATALSFGLINATVFASAAGFCGALETMLSHTYGRDPNSKLYGIYAQRMAFLLLIIAILISPLLACANMILQAFGQSPEVMVYVGQYCRIAIISVYPVMLLELLRRYFACQHLNKPLTLNLLGGAAVFPLLLWAMLSIFGFYGAPTSFCILTTGMMSGLLFHLYYSGAYKRSWGGWDRRALTNFRPMLRLALPSLAMMLSEWGSLEVNAIMAGYATPEGLAAFSIVYSISGTLWSLVSGLFITAAVMVGNALGKGRSSQARRCAYVCLFLSMVYAIVDIVVVVLLRNALPWLFVKDEAVVREFGRLIPYFLAYHFLDCIQSTMMGVFRGCGLQLVGAVGITLVLSVVGVPAGALIFFFLLDRDVMALLLGPMLGMAVVGIPYYAYVAMYYIKWDKLNMSTTEGFISGCSDQEPTGEVTSASGPDAGAQQTSHTHGDVGKGMKVATRLGEKRAVGSIYTCHEPTLQRMTTPNHADKSCATTTYASLESDLPTLCAMHHCHGDRAVSEGRENANVTNASLTSTFYLSQRNILMCASTRGAAETTFMHVTSREDAMEMHELCESMKQPCAKSRSKIKAMSRKMDELAAAAEEISDTEMSIDEVSDTCIQDAVVESSSSAPCPSNSERLDLLTTPPVKPK